MFCDKIDVKIGDESIAVRRATLEEMRGGGVAILAFLFGGQKCLDESVRQFVADHCTLSDGAPLDPGALSLPQMRELAVAIGGVPDGVPLSDFIALLL